MINATFAASPADHSACWSLADALRVAVARWPDSPALVSGTQTFSFAELSALAESKAVTADAGYITLSGDALTLAVGAFAASCRNLPFFPVDRSTMRPAASPKQDTSLLIATSGSEGAPKAIALSTRQMAVAADGANAFLGLTAGDRWLACLPLVHIGGQSILWRCARAGATISLHDGFPVTDIAADLANGSVTHISLVPAMLARLLDLGCPPPPSLRVALVGGAALSPALRERAQAAGWPLWPSYGMTETAAMIAGATPDTPWQAGDVGQLLPGHSARIDDDGRICLWGPQTGGSDWLLTGDLGCLSADGHLRIIGRADDMLICGGKNIHPASIEACLAHLPGLHELAVTGQADPVWGDRIVAVIVGTVDDETLIAHARTHLPAAAIPRRILHVGALPRTAAGKPDRLAIRQLVSEAAE